MKNNIIRNYETFLFINTFNSVLYFIFRCSRKKKKKKKRKRRKYLSDDDLLRMEAEYNEQDYDLMDDAEKEYAIKSADNEKGFEMPQINTEDSKMVFVKIFNPETGKAFKNKIEADKIGQRFKTMLEAGGLSDVQVFVVDAEQIIFQVAKGFRQIIKVRKFALEQEEVMWFDWDKKKTWRKGLEDLEDAYNQEQDEKAEKKEEAEKKELMNSKAREEAIKRAKAKRDGTLDEYLAELEAKKKKKETTQRTIN